MFTQENVIRGEGSITSRCSEDEPTILLRENRDSSRDRAYIQLFRERLSEKTCPRQSRKAIWDMINTSVAVEPTFVAFL